MCVGGGGGQNTVGVKTPVFLNNYNYIENTTIFTNKFVERKLDSHAESYFNFNYYESFISK